MQRCFFMVLSYYVLCKVHLKKAEISVMKSVKCCLKSWINSFFVLMLLTIFFQ